MQFGLACLALAACSSPKGLTIEVVPSHNVTRVELMLSMGCDSCSVAVAPVTPPGMQPMDAERFENDAAVWSAPVEDGVAGFVLTSDVDELERVTIPIVVAIGFDTANVARGTAVARDVEVTPGESVYAQWTLSPADPIDPQLPEVDGGSYRIKQWTAADASLPSCVVVEHGTDDGVERVAIGPLDDTDCDDVTPTECAPWTYRADGVGGSIDTANCHVHSTDPALAQACVAAGPSCSEVGGTATNCTPTDEDYCLAGNLCECPDWSVNCLYGAYGFGVTMPAGNYLRCTVPVSDTSGGLCSNTVVYDNVRLYPYVANTKSVLTGVRLHGVDVTIGPFGPVATFDVVRTLTVKNFDGPGTVKLVWNGPNMSDDVGLVSLDLDNGKHIVLPLAMKAQSPCGTTNIPTCDLVYGPSMDDGLGCTEQRTGPSCAPTGGCSAGPPCGLGCCNSGEHCETVLGNFTCKCGNGPACGGGSSCDRTTSLPPPGGGCGEECCNVMGPVTCTM